MLDTIQQRFGQLQCDAPFWSLRFVDERSSYLCVRQNVTEAARLHRDCGAMLTVYDSGGYGYAATSDLSVPGLQAALDRARAWAKTPPDNRSCRRILHCRIRRDFGVRPGIDERLPTSRELLGAP